ncbi:hypothetical protein F5B22DRAFT_31620 [Xylaria bambusicola]|uniref:uncharacterized protein n=1 Tax=Xylaria bambusicola TaxID=326684 RepID=UPI002007D340|nr:uncharacterized protein F5B22DRAFT_31620 [Xylaria bambusicola]KAI0520947.1 hypothetical protein F5B22DRAFT_31620 [Xylaria bambusicola]
MSSITKSSFFYKKSKSSFCKPSNPEEQTHVRKWSSCSTMSEASSAGSHRTRSDSLNPLSLHPPFNLNALPNVVPEFDIVRYQEDEEREARFFNQTRHAQDYIQDTAEYSPVKGHNCYFQGPKARPYQYDQDSQWPLKDWQAIPPGLSDSGSPAASAASSPTRLDVPRRRNTDWSADHDNLKRGAWKRRGIVFHLDERDKEMQELHFELPE